MAEVAGAHSLGGIEAGQDGCIGRRARMRWGKMERVSETMFWEVVRHPSLHGWLGKGRDDAVGLVGLQWRRGRGAWLW